MTLKEAFEKENIDVFGVCDAAEYNRVTGENYKTCIVALFPYFSGYPPESNMSIYAHGRDYHIVTRKILTSVADAMGYRDYKIHSDTGPTIERGLCIESGIAYRGRNGMCINDKYGSYFFVGYIVCNEDMEYGKPLDKTCTGCGRCVPACPGGALAEGFDKDRCLSHITQKKGELTYEERDMIKSAGQIFGCDICQRVCPHNRDIPITPIAEFRQKLVTRLNREDVEGISAREFARRYSDRAFAWRGKAVIERNIKITEEEQYEDSNT